MRFRYLETKIKQIKLGQQSESKREGRENTHGIVKHDNLSVQRDVDVCELKEGRVARKRSESLILSLTSSRATGRGSGRMMLGHIYFDRTVMGS